MTKKLLKNECGSDGLGDAAKVSEVFKCLGDSTRLRLLLLLEDEPITVGELARRAGSNQANTSKHLRLLSLHNLVVTRRVGTSVFYAVRDCTVTKLINKMSGFCAKQAEERSKHFASVNLQS